jgi:stage V sporulation protein B
MKMATVIAIPCTFGLFFLAEPVMKFIFPGRFEGIEILKYLSLAIPFIIITQTTTAILQGTGNYIKPVINLLIGCIIKVILTWVLVPMQQFNIYGAVIASFSAYTVVSILNIIAMKFKLRIKLNLYEILIKPVYAATIMILFVITSYNIIYKNTTSNGISCLTAIVLGMIIYIILIMVFKVFNIEEIKNRIRKR